MSRAASSVEVWGWRDGGMEEGWGPNSQYREKETRKSKKLQEKRVAGRWRMAWR